MRLTFRSILTSNSWSSLSGWLLKTSPWLNSWLGRSRKAESLFSDNWTSDPWLEWNRWWSCWLELLSIWAIESWFSLSAIERDLSINTTAVRPGGDKPPTASKLITRWHRKAPRFKKASHFLLIFNNCSKIIRKFQYSNYCMHARFFVSS